MKQALHIITLGVDDPARMKDFYTNSFGWTALPQEGITFFKANGLLLALYPRHELAGDATVSGQGEGFKGFTMAILMDSREEVDAAFADLRQKGVNILKDPQEVFWGGYSGYVEDPEHNLWEIAHNPFLQIGEHGIL